MAKRCRGPTFISVPTHSQAGSGKNGARAAAAPEHQHSQWLSCRSNRVSASPAGDGNWKCRSAMRRAALPSRPASAILSAMARSGQTRFDVAVVGGGAAGLAAALTAAIGGFRTVLFAPPASFPAGPDRRAPAGLDRPPVRARRLAGARPACRAAAGDPPRRRDAAADPRAGGDIPCLRDRPAGLRLQHPERRAGRCAAPARRERFEDLTLVADAGRGDRARRGRASRSEPATESSPRRSSSPPTARGRSRARRPASASGAGTIPSRRSSRRSSIQHPHQGVSTEFHTESGPFTLVPLPGDRVSLVWVDRPDAAEARAGSSDGGLFTRRREARAVDPRRDAARQPAGALSARRRARRPVRRAAHDARRRGGASLPADRRAGAEPRLPRRRGAEAACSRATATIRARRRRSTPITGTRQADVRSRTLAVDLLNRSLLTDFLPVQAARAARARRCAASVAGLLRHALMRQGMANSSTLRIRLEHETRLQLNRYFRVSGFSRRHITLSKK